MYTMTLFSIYYLVFTQLILQKNGQVADCRGMGAVLRMYHVLFV